VLGAAIAPSVWAQGTTAFTCAEGTAEAGFADEHCDSPTTGEGVKFVHKSIPLGASLTIFSNAKTAEETSAAVPTSFSWTFGGIAVRVECTKASGAGTIENRTIEGTMQAIGTTQIEYSGCSVTKPSGSSCKVQEPVIEKVNFSTYEAGEEEMGVELTPSEKGVFATIVIEGCSIKGTYKITGNAQGTPGGSPNGRGATLAFTEGMGSLAFGGSPVTFLSTVTEQTKAIFGLPEDPIVLTTTE